MITLGINGAGELSGQLANPFTWKMSVKMECECVVGWQEGQLA